MLLKHKNRLSRPDDWVQVEPGVWEIHRSIKLKKGWVGVLSHRFGPVQCRICGEPITNGIGLCHECTWRKHRHERGQWVEGEYAERFDETGRMCEMQ